jgi:hypothetical protein
MSMDEVETMEKLHKIITDGVGLSLDLIEVGRSSDSLYQATFERYGRAVNEVISGVAKVKTALFDEYREAKLAEYLGNKTGSEMLCMFCTKRGTCALPRDKNCCSIGEHGLCNSYGKVVCEVKR